MGRLLNLISGMRNVKNNMEITVKSITTPILPTLNKNFVFDGKRAAILDYELETQLRKFRCTTASSCRNDK